MLERYLNTEVFLCQVTSDVDGYKSIQSETAILARIQDQAEDRDTIVAGGKEIVADAIIYTLTQLSTGLYVKHYSENEMFYRIAKVDVARGADGTAHHYKGYLQITRQNN